MNYINSNILKLFLVRTLKAGLVCLKKRFPAKLILKFRPQNFTDFNLRVSIGVRSIYPLMPMIMCGELPRSPSQYNTGSASPLIILHLHFTLQPGTLYCDYCDRFFSSRRLTRAIHPFRALASTYIIMTGFRNKIFYLMCTS